MYQVDAVVAPVETRQECMFQEVDVCIGVEVVGLVAIGELTVCNIDAGKQLLGVALAACWNVRLGIASSPCLVQCRRLTERRLVFVNDYRAFFPGFFLRLG